MYSNIVRQVFDEQNLATGDRVRITTHDGTHEGVLMPRSAQGNTDTVVIKLDNGYNLGVAYSDETEIELIEKSASTDEEPATMPEHDPDKPDIAILHTGGTIASRVSYEEGGVKPAFEPEDLLDIYPELFEQANISTSVVAQMFSEDMEPAHWKAVAQAVAEQREDVDGIIIGHGTDTMHFTAAALSFMLENIDIPVVLVGSQRSSDRPSSDAALNLLSALTFIRDGAPGVYVCMHSSMSDTEAAIHRGVNVRKMHTSRRDAFQSIDTEPFALVNPDEDQVEFLENVSYDTESEFTLRDELDTRVGLLKTAPGLSAGAINGYRENGYRGLIVEGTGLGHLPVNVLDEHTEHHSDVLDAVDTFADEGVVVMSSQCLNGRVNMNVYDSGVKLQHAGVLSAENMIPEVAYVKLMWALGQTDSVEEAKELFRTNVAGEFIEREEYDAY